MYTTRSGRVIRPAPSVPHRAMSPAWDDDGSDEEADPSYVAGEILESDDEDVEEEDESETEEEEEEEEDSETEA